MRRVLLKIILVYSDQAAAHLGTAVTTTLRQELGSAFQVAQTVWKTELLRNGSLRRLAAQEAREANVVIVAASAAGDLPEELQKWLALWMDRDRGTPGAFVALLHRQEGQADDSIVDTLREKARLARMEFFCHFAGASSGLGQRRRGAFDPLGQAAVCAP